jgi:AcrR family transcriptional regulator
MGSNKSRANALRGALEPRRRPGKERVAALMEAAASVIAERGFEAATMAEIAARAGALIGSLYHFFPNKEVLADALIQRYGQIIDEAFARIDSQAASMPIEALADALVYFLVEIQGESKAMRALLESRAEFTTRRHEFRNAALSHIARTLMLRSPRLCPETAQHMAVVLLQNMKNMKTLAADHEAATSGGASAELRDMTRIYLASKLADRD